MRVTLIASTPYPEHAIATAARQCYTKNYVGEDFLNTANDDNLLTKIMEMGHESVLEHASFTFAIGDVSRSLTHQLVRFRIASFSQQSQRYVRILEDFDYVIPKSIVTAHETELYYDTMEELAKVYKRLIDSGVPPEDARFVLPNACCTHIVMTMNVRELLHAFTLRCCAQAQWEIREMFNLILAMVKVECPTVFKHAGPNCIRGFCTEGVRSCKSLPSVGGGL